MSVVERWSDHDVGSLSHVIQHCRDQSGLSPRVLEDVRHIVGADHVLLIEHTAEQPRLVACAPLLELVDGTRTLSPAAWSVVWDCEHCPADGSSPSDGCVTDHLHRLRPDPRVNHAFGGAHLVIAALASSTAEARLVLVRWTHDFDERDCMVLELLRPHLARAYRRLETRRGAADNLTPRQRTVLRLVAHGCSNEQIAARLVLSPGTVRKHLDNVFRQLGVSSRAAAVARAFPEGVPIYPVRAGVAAALPRQRVN